MKSCCQESLMEGGVKGRPLFNMQKRGPLSLIRVDLTSLEEFRILKGLRTCALIPQPMMGVLCPSLDLVGGGKEPVTLTGVYHCEVMSRVSYDSYKLLPSYKEIQTLLSFWHISTGSTNCPKSCWAGRLQLPMTFVSNPSSHCLHPSSNQPNQNEVPFHIQLTSALFTQRIFGVTSIFYPSSYNSLPPLQGCTKRGPSSLSTCPLS